MDALLIEKIKATKALERRLGKALSQYHQRLHRKTSLSWVMWWQFGRHILTRLQHTASS